MSWTRLVIVVAALASIGAVGSARADSPPAMQVLDTERPPAFAPLAEPPVDEPAPRQGPRDWYGDEILVCDAISTAAIAGYGIGLGGLALGSPLIHFSHGNYGEGMGALALRILLPTLFAVGAYAATPGCGADCGDFGDIGRIFTTMAAGLVGLGLAITLDVTFLAFDDDVPDLEAERTLEGATSPVSPRGW